jgi:hypothetical protein
MTFAEKVAHPHNRNHSVLALTGENRELDFALRDIEGSIGRVALREDLTVSDVPPASFFGRKDL